MRSLRQHGQRIMTQRSDSIQIPALSRQDGWAPNPRDISTTPGGSFYATTPGGTKIRWTRDQLMLFANSPLSRSPLPSLPKIAGVTVDSVSVEPDYDSVQVEAKGPIGGEDGELFEMDT